MALKETDLYGPVKEFLEKSGYVVRAEVRDCDLTAVRGDELVVVELKRVFGLKLLTQAVTRQKAADSVYVAIPRPARGRFSKSYWNMCTLLKRLELGLLMVSFTPGRPAVEVVLHPPSTVPRGVREPQARPRRNTRMRRSILREFTGRSGDYNTGGSRGALVTAYRESSIRIACCLERYGPLSPARLREIGTGDKTYSILYHNVYGWFEHVDKGQYGLHTAGKSALRAYPALRTRYRKELGLDGRGRATRGRAAPVGATPDTRHGRRAKIGDTAAL